MRPEFTFTIPRFLISKLATDPISIENFKSPEIRQVTNLMGLKSDRQLKSFIFNQKSKSALTGKIQIVK
jgi:hypothetical protein